MKSKRLSCTTTAPIAEAVEHLLFTGFWGRTRAEVVERLVSHALRDVLPAEFIDELACEIASEELQEEGSRCAN